MTGTIAEQEWWHVTDLPDGSSTPGIWDLRPTADEIPWPELHGKRCLDVGTADGFWAFELAHALRGLRKVAEPAGWRVDAQTGILRDHLPPEATGATRSASEAGRQPFVLVFEHSSIRRRAAR